VYPAISYGANAPAYRRIFLLEDILMFYFDRHYFYLTLMLLVIEVTIAVFIQDRFIRPFVGDVLVVILIYCLLKSFLRLNATKVAISVLVFAFVVEILQYFNLVDLLGLRTNRIATIVLGSTFDWLDLLAYTIGISIVACVENNRHSIRLR
jgi:Protein of unknown function (DUF2809)